jgi:hypothetical protein
MGSEFMFELGGKNAALPHRDVYRTDSRNLATC